MRGRVALAGALTEAGESCPILLDDALVQSDRARKERLLTLLHELSRDHQTVLFTQEEDVAERAVRQLDPQRDRLVSWYASDASRAVPAPTAREPPESRRARGDHRG